MCVYKLAKYLLFAFNFCFWLAGAAILGVAIWILVDDDISDVIEVADGINIYTGSYVLIAAGVIMLIVGFAGCCGAMKESTCLLGLYFTCLFAIFALEVGIAIWGFVEYDSLDQAISDSLNGTNVYDQTFQNFQKNFKCCGLTTVCDGFNTTHPYLGCDCTGKDDNCKVFKDDGTCPGSGTGVSIYNTPCDDALYDFVEDNMLLLAGIALGIGLAEVLGMIISMCLCCKIKDKGEL